MKITVFLSDRRYAETNARVRLVGAMVVDALPAVGVVRYRAGIEPRFARGRGAARVRAIWPELPCAPSSAKYQSDLAEFELGDRQCT